MGGEAMSHAAIDLRAAPDARMAARAASLFAEAMRDRYGTHLRGVYLFGSRARGDQRPFSDVDLAVVVDGSFPLEGETKPLAEAAYDIFLETGAEIQPWLFAEAEWHRAATPLVRNVKRDARVVEAA
jgi:antitoxin ChpS